MSDADITCDLPAKAGPTAAMNVRYSHALVRLCQLMSFVMETVANTQKARSTGEALFATFCDLRARADSLEQSLNPTVYFDRRIDATTLPPGLTLQQTTYLHYTLYSTLIYMHTSLTCPWSEALLWSTPHPGLQRQIDQSSHSLAEICRKAILVTEHIQFNAGTPVP